MNDVCAGGLSNYERKKQALLGANIWKSNFISLWKKYGSFKDVDGVQTFDKYKIDGPGTGQERMSRHLQSKDMWKETQHKDVKSVSLWFNLNKLLKIDSEHARAWLEETKEALEQDSFDVLKYEIENDEVVSHGFYLKGELVEDVFYDNVSSYIAEKKLDDLLSPGDVASFSYEETVTVEEIEAVLDTVTVLKFDDDGTSKYIDKIEEAIQGYASKEGIGTDILDELVAKGYATTVGTVGLDLQYHLPLESAKKMNGFVFIELVTKTLDFKIKKKGGFWRALKRFMKLILAAIAVYFQQYWLAASLLVGFVADETNSKVLRIVSTLLALMQGDITSLSNIGVSEGLNVLLSIYSIYIDLKFKPDKGIDTVEDTDSMHNMLYEAPNDAYDGIYCYEDLVTVKIAGN